MKLYFKSFLYVLLASTSSIVLYLTLTKQINIVGHLKSPSSRGERPSGEKAEKYNRFADIDFNQEQKVLVNMTAARINRLLRIVQIHESKFHEQLEHLNVMFFKKLLAKDNSSYFGQYKYELETFTRRDGDYLEVNDLFANMLDKRSDFFTFSGPKRNYSRAALKKVIIVITICLPLVYFYKNLVHFSP